MLHPLEITFTLFWTPQFLEKNELRHDIAVSSWRRVVDGSFFLQAAHHSIECFVRQVVGMIAVLAVEIRNQAAADLQVTLSV